MDKIEQILEKVRNCSQEEELLEYAASSTPGVALEVSKSPHATANVLKTLATNPSLVIRHEVAKNPQTPRESLEKMLGDRDMLIHHYARQTLAKLR